MNAENATKQSAAAWWIRCIARRPPDARKCHSVPKREHPCQGQTTVCRMPGRCEGLRERALTSGGSCATMRRHAQAAGRIVHASREEHAMAEFSVTPQTRVRRIPDRAHYDKESVY